MNTKSNDGKKITIDKFCSLDIFQAKMLYTIQQVIPTTPTTPQSKEEGPSKNKGKATISNELDELQLLKKEMKLFKKQKQLLLIFKDSSSDSSSSSAHSSYDPFGGPCAQDPNEF